MALLVGLVGAIAPACRSRDKLAPDTDARLSSAASAADPSAATSTDEATRYLDDVSFRRDVLLRSMTNHDNSYARQRIGNYALGTRGWDTLPEWNPRSRPVTSEVRMQLAEGRALPLVKRGTKQWNCR